MLLSAQVGARQYVVAHDTGSDPAYPAIEVWVPADEQRRTGLVIGEFGFWLADAPGAEPTASVELPRTLVYRIWCHAMLRQSDCMDSMRLLMDRIEQKITADYLDVAADPVRLLAGKCHFWRARNYSTIGFANTTAWHATRHINGRQVHVATCMRLIGDSCLVLTRPNNVEHVCATVASARRCVDAHVAAIEAAETCAVSQTGPYAVR